MIDISFNEFLNKDFRLYEGNPVIKRYGMSSIIADPSVISPDEGKDGKWHLFCHTIFGVYRFESGDGISFVNKGRVVKNAMRPDVKVIGGEYYLYFERVQPLIRRGLAAVGAIKWFSEIYLTKSKDLISWTEPVRVIKADRTYMIDKQGISVSNPFLIEKDGKYRLYFSAGLTYLKDCKFSEPTHISYAESDSPDGPFVTREQPVLSPTEEVEWLNRGCGCIKVYRLKDSFIGLLNGIYVGDDGKSRSAIMLFKSDDGDNFSYAKHILKPCVCGNSRWMAQYVYACNLVRYGDKFYLYFNARDKANPVTGKENIGIAVAE